MAVSLNYTHAPLSVIAWRQINQWRAFDGGNGLALLKLVRIYAAEERTVVERVLFLTYQAIFDPIQGRLLLTDS